MTTVSAAATTASLTTEAQKKATVDYNAFLKLLVAQAKNQDPTNPTDSTQYLSQLASFSAVEQGIQTNQKLEQMLASSRLAEANGLIGRDIVSADGAVAGRVAFVTLMNGEIAATLVDGTTLTIGDGVSIGQK